MLLHILPQMFVFYRGVEHFVQMGGFNDMSPSLVLMPGQPSCCTTLNCLPSFLGGILALAVVEVLCVLYFISRLLAKKRSHPSPASSLEYTSEASSISFSLQVTSLLLWLH